MKSRRYNDVVMQPSSSEQDIIACSSFDDVQSSFRSQTPKLKFDPNLSDGVLHFTIIPLNCNIGDGKLVWWHPKFLQCYYGDKVKS